MSGSETVSSHWRACRFGNSAQHAGKYELVERIDRIPVEQTADAERIEDRGLPDERARAFALDFKLQPGAAGQIHLREQSQQPVRLHRFDSPGSPPLRSVAAQI